MTTYISFLLVFLSLLNSPGTDPAKKETKRWYKGNLHTHSYWSDGDEFPEMIMDWYKTHGYDFVALSDHNTMARGEKWVKHRDMIGLRGERFFEVYNGHPLVHNEGDSLHPGTEQMWDDINLAYFKKNQPLMLGLGTDDSHSYHQFGTAYSNAGRGWVMVYAASLDARTLIEAMERGDFYASSGVMLKNLSVQKRSISVEVQPEPGVAYTIEFIGATADAEKATVLKRVAGTEGRFQLTAQHRFVRARVTSDKPKPNPYRQGEVEMAWTQPVTYK